MIVFQSVIGVTRKGRSRLAASWSFFTIRFPKLGSDCTASAKVARCWYRSEKRQERCDAMRCCSFANSEVCDLGNGCDCMGAQRA